jgi:hypothetical protein
LQPLLTLLLPRPLGTPTHVLCTASAPLARCSMAAMSARRMEPQDNLLSTKKRGCLR